MEKKGERKTDTVKIKCGIKKVINSADVLQAGIKE